MASNLSLDSPLAKWLSACQNRSSSDPSTTPTPYSAPSFSTSSDFLPSFLGLLQCRHDIDQVIAQLGQAKRVVGVKAQLANMHMRFQRLVQNTQADFWVSVATMGTAARPFEEIRFDQKGKARQVPRGEVSHGLEESSEEEEEEEEGEVDEDDKESAESKEEECEVDEDDEESAESEEDDPKEAWTRFQRKRQMYILHLVVSRHRVGRLIANAKGSGSMLLRRQVYAGAVPPALKCQVIAELEAIATVAKSELAEEMQREAGATEAYRVAMIGVLQDELRR